MYSYLTFGLVLGLIWLVLFFLRKDLRKEMLFVGLLLAPFGLTDPLFIPQYWDPVVIYKFFGLFDIEGILHIFFLMGIAAVIYEAVLGYHHAKMKSKTERKAARGKAIGIYAALVLLALFLIFIRLFTDFSVIRGAFLFGLFFLIYLSYLRPDLYKSGLISGALTVIVYIAVLLFMKFVFTDFIGQWNPAGTAGFFLGIPIEEYFYGFGIGFLCSFLYETIKGNRLKKK